MPRKSIRAMNQTVWRQEAAREAAEDASVKEELHRLDDRIIQAEQIVNALQLDADVTAEIAERYTEISARLETRIQVARKYNEYYAQRAILKARRDADAEILELYNAAIAQHAPLDELAKHLKPTEIELPHRTTAKIVRENGTYTAELFAPDTASEEPYRVLEAPTFTELIVAAFEADDPIKIWTQEDEWQAMEKDYDDDRRMYGDLRYGFG
jgi:hypothetical protein